MFHGGYWRSAREWPLPETKRVPLYLRAGGHLAPEEAPLDTAPIRYDFDPTDPCPAIGGNMQEAGVPDFLLGGPYDQLGRHRDGPAG